MQEKAVSFIGNAWSADVTAKVCAVWSSIISNYRSCDLTKVVTWQMVLISINQKLLYIGL